MWWIGNEETEGISPMKQRKMKKKKTPAWVCLWVFCPSHSLSGLIGVDQQSSTFLHCDPLVQFLKFVVTSNHKNIFVATSELILLLFMNHNVNIMVFRWSMVDPCESDVCPQRVCVPQVENHHSRSWEAHWTEKKPRVKIRCSSLDRRREVNPVRKVTVKVTHG